MIINQYNLDTYVDSVSHMLKWAISDHRAIYHDVAKQQDIETALDILDQRVVPWFIRKGSMSHDWRLLVKTAVSKLRAAGFILPDLRDRDKLNYVTEVLRPLGRIKLLKSESENYVPASKLLHFFFPSLIPKTDLAWIQHVCLCKVNTTQLFTDTFRVTGFIDLAQYNLYLQLGASQSYPPSLLGKLDDAINVRDAYAVVFEYCLLGFCADEIARIRSEA